MMTAEGGMIAGTATDITMTGRGPETITIEGGIDGNTEMEKY